MAAHKAKQPEPVLTRGGVVTAIAVLSALCVHYGLGNASSWLNDNTDWIAGLILAAGPVVTAVISRVHVTPLAAPKTDDGVPLVPVVSAPTVKSAADDVVAEVDAALERTQQA